MSGLVNLLNTNGIEIKEVDYWDSIFIRLADKNYDIAIKKEEGKVYYILRFIDYDYLHIPNPFEIFRTDSAKEVVKEAKKELSARFKLFD